jgi:hypothetical protein
MARLQLTPPVGLDHAQLLAGAVRHAMALGAIYYDVRGHLLADEHEVLAALARDRRVTSSRGVE